MPTKQVRSSGPAGSERPDRPFRAHRSMLQDRRQVHRFREMMEQPGSTPARSPINRPAPCPTDPAADGDRAGSTRRPSRRGARFAAVSAPPSRRRVIGTVCPARRTVCLRLSVAARQGSSRVRRCSSPGATTTRVSTATAPWSRSGDRHSRRARAAVPRDPVGDPRRRRPAAGARLPRRTRPQGRRRPAGSRRRDRVAGRSPHVASDAALATRRISSSGGSRPARPGAPGSRPRSNRAPGGRGPG